MLSRTTFRVVVPSALMILVGSIPSLNGWTELGLTRSQGGTEPGRRPEPQQPSPAAPKPGVAAPNAHSRSEDELAIRAVDEAFVRDYNKGDSKALAAMFTEDAEVVEADGPRYRGRDLIEQGFADTFAASNGTKIAFEIEAIRFLSPDVAEEEGRSVVTPEKGAPVSRLYTVLYVKRDGAGSCPASARSPTRWSAHTTGSRNSNGWSASGSTRRPTPWPASTADGPRTGTS